MVEQLYLAEIDAVTRAEWSELLGRFADANLYQTWSYGAIRWGEANLSHLILRRNGEVVGLAQVRIICSPLVKRGVAYLRWGPACQLRGQELDLETTRQMALALHEEYVRKRRLFLRILPDAFAGSRRAEVLLAAFFTCIASSPPIRRIPKGPFCWICRRRWPTFAKSSTKNGGTS